MTESYPQVRKSETVRNSPIPDQSVRSESPRVLKDSDFRTAGENGSHLEIVSTVIQFARQLRDRFGPGVKLTFHMEPGRTQGRQPYWWNCHD